MTDGITPVQEIKGLRVKRDDLFCPYDSGGVNGGKLRQCVLLVEKNISKYKGIVTYCGLGSPQGPIVAAVGKDKGIPAIVVYGGTTRETIFEHQMPRLVAHYGGKIAIGARTRRHNVLHKAAKRIADESGYFLVQYGINLEEHEDVLIDAVAKQVSNVPDCKNLVAVCGSGITASGILIGLHRYGVNVESVHLVATGPDRRKLIKSITEKHGAFRHIEYHDVNNNGMLYDKGVNARIGDIRLHPNYEAKAYLWYKASGLKDEDTVFWITGAKPRLCSKR